MINWVKVKTKYADGSLSNEIYYLFPASLHTLSTELVKSSWNGCKIIWFIIQNLPVCNKIHRGVGYVLSMLNNTRIA